MPIHTHKNKIKQKTCETRKQKFKDMFESSKKEKKEKKKKKKSVPKHNRWEAIRIEISESETNQNQPSKQTNKKNQ